MKSSFVLFFSILVSLAIVAPSVVTLFELDNDITLLADFNEDESKNEEKNELDENLIWFDARIIVVSSLEKKSSNHSNNFSKTYYANSVEILLPPPKLKV